MNWEAISAIGEITGALAVYLLSDILEYRLERLERQQLTPIGSIAPTV